MHFSFNCLGLHVDTLKEKMQPLNSPSPLIIPLLTCESQSTRNGHIALTKHNQYLKGIHD